MCFHPIIRSPQHFDASTIFDIASLSGCAVKHAVCTRQPDADRRQDACAASGLADEDIVQLVEDKSALKWRYTNLH